MIGERDVTGKWPRLHCQAPSPVGRGYTLGGWPRFEAAEHRVIIEGHDDRASTYQDPGGCPPSDVG